MRALIYCRVSSERQVVDGHGLEGQEKRCRDYAKNHNYTIVGIFREEGISGGVIERPQMQRLLIRLEDYKDESDKTIVIIDDIKRLARDVQGHFILRTAINSRNGDLESPSHRFEDSPEGKFVETVLAGAAELERNQNKQQVMNRMKARAEMGHWPFCLPPGLKNQKNPVHGKVAQRDEPIATIFKSAIEGYRDRILLTQQDVISFIQNQYEKQGVNRKISLHGVQSLLTEILYTGYIEYPKWNISRRKGTHDGFISLETFEEVQKILNDRTKPKVRRDTSSNFSLRGLVLCSLCHTPLTASLHHGRKGQLYPHYFCRKPGCELKDKSVRKKDLESSFLAYLGSIKLGKPVANLALAVLTDVWDQQQAQLIEEQRTTESKRQETEQAIFTVNTLIRKTTNEKLIRNYENELIRLQEQKENLENTNIPTHHTKEQFGTASEKVLSILENPADTWQTGDLNDRLAVYFMHFDQKPSYDRNLGFGTATLAQPVAMIRSLGSEKIHSVEMPGNEPGSES